MAAKVLTTDDVRKDLQQIRRLVYSVHRKGFAFYAMNSDLMVLDPSGVKALGDSDLASAGNDVRDHLEDVCDINDSGGW